MNWIGNYVETDGLGATGRARGVSFGGGGRARGVSFGGGRRAPGRVYGGGVARGIGPAAGSSMKVVGGKAHGVTITGKTGGGMAVGLPRAGSVGAKVYGASTGKGAIPGYARGTVTEKTGAGWDYAAWLAGAGARKARKAAGGFTGGLMPSSGLYTSISPMPPGALAPPTPPSAYFPPPVTGPSAGGGGGGGGYGPVDESLLDPASYGYGTGYESGGGGGGAMPGEEIMPGGDELPPEEVAPAEEAPVEAGMGGAKTWLLMGAAGIAIWFLFFRKKRS